MMILSDCEGTIGDQRNSYKKNKINLAACLWLALSLVMYCRFQRPFLAVGDSAAVLHDLDSTICEFSLV